MDNKALIMHITWRGGMTRAVDCLKD